MAHAASSGVLLGALALGAVPHEFFLWRDPAQPRRLLLYAAMWDYQQPDLHVVDLTDPANLRRVGAWTAASAGAPSPPSIPPLPGSAGWRSCRDSGGVEAGEPA